MDTRHAHDVHPYSTSPLRPLGLSHPPGPPPGSLSAGRAAAAEPAFPSYASSAAAPPPSRLFCLIPLTPPPAIPRPTPRARAAALGRVASPPREGEPAPPGRRVAPALAVSLSSLARPPPPLAPLQARGGVALPVEDRGGPVATAAGLPPVSPHVPTPLSKAASAHLSPPPTTDPKPPLGPSGLGFPVRRWVRYHTAVTPFPHLLLPGTPASGGAAPDPPGHSERVHTAAAPPAAGVEAAVGAAGTVAALAAQTPGVEPLGRPHDPAAVPVAGVEMAVWVAETMAALAAAPLGVEPQGRLLDPAVAPAAGAEVVVAGAGPVAAPAAAPPGAGPRGMPPASAAVPAVVPRVGRLPRSWGGAELSTPLEEGGGQGLDPPTAPPLPPVALRQVVDCPVAAPPPPSPGPSQFGPAPPEYQRPSFVQTAGPPMPPASSHSRRTPSAPAPPTVSAPVRCR